MKHLITILTSLLSLHLNASSCEEIKQETIFYLSSSTTSDKTNEFMASLSECGFDKYELAMISYPELFMQLIDNLVASSESDITVGDLVTSFQQFKDKDSSSFQEYYSGIKQLTDYYMTEVTLDNLDSYINDWNQRNGEEIAVELKEFIIQRNIPGSQISYKSALNEFYFKKYQMLVFDENLNSISWYNHGAEDKGQQIDKSYYEDRISISATISDTEILLSIELADSWNIYSINNETANIFRASIESSTQCFEILKGIMVTNETMVNDPMDMRESVNLISGNSTISIPYKKHCDAIPELAFTFSLIKDDGSSLPFIKEIIEVD